MLSFNTFSKSTTKRPTRQCSRDIFTKTFQTPTPAWLTLPLFSRSNNTTICSITVTHQILVLEVQVLISLWSMHHSGWSLHRTSDCSEIQLHQRANSILQPTRPRELAQIKHILSSSFSCACSSLVALPSAADLYTHTWCAHKKRSLCPSCPVHHFHFQLCKMSYRGIQDKALNVLL